MSSFRKPKTAKGRRLARKREAKVIEGEKSAIFLKTTTATAVIGNALLDLATLKKPLSKLLSHRNPIQPFEDATSLEFLTQVNHSSLFVVGSNNKKRPQALTFGRTFDGQILDMMEFTMDPTTFRSIQSLSKERETTARLGAKPMLIFLGDAFETSEDMKQFKSLMLDFFHIQDTPKMNLAGLDRVIQFTASTDVNDLSKKVVTFRHYTVQKKKGADKFPKVVLEEAGPRLDLTFTRAVKASRDLQAQAARIHKQARLDKHKKNIEYGFMGEKLGRLHMEKQDFNQIALKKTKSLGKGKRANVIAPLKELDYKAGGKVRKRPEDDGDFSDDFDKITKGSTKRQKTIPSAYLSSIISE
jgi:ribosome production factor 2